MHSTPEGQSPVGHTRHTAALYRLHTVHHVQEFQNNLAAALSPRTLPTIQNEGRKYVKIFTIQLPKYLQHTQSPYPSASPCACDTRSRKPRRRSRRRRRSLRRRYATRAHAESIVDVALEPRMAIQAEEGPRNPQPFPLQGQDSGRG
jgi:hypothetical protein